VHPRSGTSRHGPPYSRALSARPEQYELRPTTSLQDGEGGGKVLRVREVLEWADGDDGRKIRKAENCPRNAWVSGNASSDP
jgi:hypothetical protein